MQSFVVLEMAGNDAMQSFAVREMPAGDWMQFSAVREMAGNDVMQSSGVLEMAGFQEKRPKTIKICPHSPVVQISTRPKGDLPRKQPR